MTSSIHNLEPYNLRIAREPVRCLTGVTVPAGLVGFCWDTPLCADVLSQQSPALGGVLEVLDGLRRHADESEDLLNVARDYVALIDAHWGSSWERPSPLPLPWKPRLEEGQ
jgi:hypothetical protein